MDEELTVKQLMAKIKDTDAGVRAAAWQSAGQLGAAAVRPLAALMGEMDASLSQLATDSGADKDDVTYTLEVKRAAQRALWVVVRHVGRPGADEEKMPVVGRLCKLLADDQPVAVQREVLWMLSEIGNQRAVKAIHGIPDVLDNKDIREDARCAIERIPGRQATQALTEVLEESTDKELQLAIAHSLRVRGVEVDEERYPPQKLIPMKQTKVVPVS